MFAVPDIVVAEGDEDAADGAALALFAGDVPLSPEQATIPDRISTQNTNIQARFMTMLPPLIRWDRIWIFRENRRQNKCMPTTPVCYMKDSRSLTQITGNRHRTS